MSDLLKVLFVHGTQQDLLHQLCNAVNAEQCTCMLLMQRCQYDSVTQKR